MSKSRASVCVLLLFAFTGSKQNGIPACRCDHDNLWNHREVRRGALHHPRSHHRRNADGGVRYGGSGGDLHAQVRGLIVVTERHHPGCVLHCRTDGASLAAE